MRKMLKILGIFLLIIIALGAIFYIVDYIIYKETGESILLFKNQMFRLDEGADEKITNEMDQAKQEVENEEKELNNNELKAIGAFLNQSGNNGFILSSYNNISEIDLYYLFTTTKYLVKSEEEIKKYEELANTTVTTGLYKVKAEEIIELLVSKTGAQIGENNLKSMNFENFTYSQADGSYYVLNSDDLFTKVKCTSGTKINDTYTVYYESEEETGNNIKGYIVLERNRSQNSTNDWFFVSNEITETNLY